MYKDTDKCKAELKVQNKMSDGWILKMDDNPIIMG
jgi:hypothetical protein